jgi:hypothetical protein
MRSSKQHKHRTAQHLYHSGCARLSSRCLVHIAASRGMFSTELTSLNVQEIHVPIFSTDPSKSNTNISQRFPKGGDSSWGPNRPRICFYLQRRFHLVQVTFLRRSRSILIHGVVYFGVSGRRRVPVRNKRQSRR